MGEFYYSDGSVMDIWNEKYPAKLRKAVFYENELNDFNNDVNYKINLLNIEKTAAKEECKALKYKYEKRLSEVEKENKNLRATLDSIKENEKILNSNIKDLSERLRAAKMLNSDLKRICRERANADRNIVPKKSRCGYVILSTSEWHETVNTNITFKEWRKLHPDINADFYDPVLKMKVGVWKSVLQTPCQASISYQAIKYEIFDEFNNVIRFDLGIDIVQSPEKNGEFLTVKSEEGTPACVLYKWLYRANMRSGYWELDLYTSEPLVINREFYP